MTDNINSGIKFEQLNVSGEGTFSRVYEVRGKDGVSALKRNRVLNGVSFIGSVRELDILKRLQGHPNIVTLNSVIYGDPGIKDDTINNRAVVSRKDPLRDSLQKDIMINEPPVSIQKDDQVHFVFEKADCNGADFIYARVTETLHKMIAMVHLLLGMEYMHAKGIMHRDMKPQNALCCSNNGRMRFKWCDFGLSKPMTKQGLNSCKVTTSWYRAPEVCNEDGYYNEKMDVWSMGCILYEIVKKEPLLNKTADESKAVLARSLELIIPDLKGSTIGNLRDRLLNLSYAEIENFETVDNKRINGLYGHFVDLLDNMLKINYKNRYSATEALNHKFFDYVRSIITKTREMYPPVPDPEPTIKIVVNKIRQRFIHNSSKVFNNRKVYPWLKDFKDRTMFQAIDIGDRYIQYLEENNLTASIDPKRIDIHYCVCLYIAVKYFTVLEVPVTYDILFKGPFKDPTALKEAENFEKILIREILKYKIYRPTVYEAADLLNVYLNENQKVHLFILYGYIEDILRRDSTNSNNVFDIRPSDLLNMCLQNSDRIQRWVDCKQKEIEDMKK